MSKYQPGKENKRGEMEQFKCIDLSELPEACRQANEDGKFVYISDGSGEAATFFKYQAEWDLFEFHGLVKKAIIPPKKGTH